MTTNPMDYIKPELLLLIPVAYIIGSMLKNAEWVKDKHIPIALGGAGIVLATIWTLATTAMSTYQEVCMAIFVAVTQGLLCSGAAVYFSQVYIQSKKEE